MCCEHHPLCPRFVGHCEPPLRSMRPPPPHILPPREPLPPLDPAQDRFEVRPLKDIFVSSVIARREVVREGVDRAREGERERERVERGGRGRRSRGRGEERVEVLRTGDNDVSPSRKRTEREV